MRVEYKMVYPLDTQHMLQVLKDANKNNGWVFASLVPHQDPNEIAVLLTRPATDEDYDTVY